jgi:hypothetical protein
MPLRGDFDVEHANGAELVLAELEFGAADSDSEKRLKVDVCKIYNAQLDERERRKRFVVERGLVDYAARAAEEKKRPRDEQDLVARMRVFARFQTAPEHEVRPRSARARVFVMDSSARVSVWVRIRWPSLQRSLSPSLSSYRAPSRPLAPSFPRPHCARVATIRPPTNKAFVDGLLEAKRLRQRIDALQHWRRHGVRTLGEGALYDHERDRQAAATAATALPLPPTAHDVDPPPAAAAASGAAAWARGGASHLPRLLPPPAASQRSDQQK